MCIIIVIYILQTDPSLDTIDVVGTRLIILAHIDKASQNKIKMSKASGQKYSGTTVHIIEVILHSPLVINNIPANPF